MHGSVAVICVNDIVSERVCEGERESLGEGEFE